MANADTSRVQNRCRLLGGRPEGHASDGEEGFSLIELVIASALAAFVFAALASLLGQSLKTLTVAKSRTQGNEVATEGIEELQRLPYGALGVCKAAPNPPPEFVNTAMPICPDSGVTDSFGDDPCNTTTVGAGVPKSKYSCVRNGVTYNVRRYVAWSDPGKTSKSMGVFVTWRDPVGLHEVSQLSSVRAAGQADIYGLTPPTITSLSVTGSVTHVRPEDPVTPEKEAGLLPSGTTVALSAATTNVTGADKVFAVFTTLDADDNQITSSKNLIWSGNNNWNVQITAADLFRFAPGTQYFSFGVIRGEDGKANSAFPTSANTFCIPVDGSCGISGYPRFEGVLNVEPSSFGPDIKVDSGGQLMADSIVVSATTRNTTDADTVSVSFQTAAGAVSVALQLAAPCDTNTTTCTWTGSIPKVAGYNFQVGSRQFYFLVKKTGGSTGADASAFKNFTLP